MHNSVLISGVEEISSKSEVVFYSIDLRNHGQKVEQDAFGIKNISGTEFWIDIATASLL